MLKSLGGVKFADDGGSGGAVQAVSKVISAKVRHNKSQSDANFNNVFNSLRSSQNPEKLLTTNIASSLCKICCEAISHASSMYLSDPTSLSRAVGELWGSTCVFFLHGYILPLLSLLESSLPKSSPTTLLPFPLIEPHGLGIGPNFWSSIAGVIKVCKIYDEVVWGWEAGKQEGTVSEILSSAGVMTELTVARERRIRFVKDVEKAGGNVLSSAIETLSDHIKWVLVSGEQKAGSSRGAYSISNAEDLGSGCSSGVEEMVRSLDATLDRMEPDESRDEFWNALMERSYSVFIDRILNHLKVSVMGSIVLSRDVESISSFCKEAAGPSATCVEKWEHLRELLCVFVTPPEALPSIIMALLDGDIVTDKDTIAKFLARRSDWRSKGGLSRSTYANEVRSCM